MTTERVQRRRIALAWQRPRPTLVDSILDRYQTDA